MNAQHCWPTEIRLTPDKQTLRISFDDGASYALSAELLRVISPSAEVQGHSAADRKTIGGKRNVRILKVEPVGNYAIRISFDDMHSTGIYTWPFLYESGRTADALFADYCKELAAKGLDRDTAGEC